MFRAPGLFLAVVLAARFALAAGGVLEINQACAAAGCFTGDSPGFPVTIAASGSYALTSNLQIADVNTTAIRIAADKVSVDLAGFSISGPNTCSAGSGGCAAIGAGGGIVGPDAIGVAVHDGTIEGMGANGIEIGSGASVERVFARFNGGFGIYVQSGSSVRANRVTSNGDGGMWLGSRTAYADNVILGDAPLGPSIFFSGSATATGGNVCDDGLCSATPWRRRYYLTSARGDGKHTTSACAPGFHFAALYEILQTSNLEYDTNLGRRGADTGSGPPAGPFDSPGWIRSSAPGLPNCNGWSSNDPVLTGTMVFLLPPLATITPGPHISPWGGNFNNNSCDTALSTWCVQD